MIARNCDVCCAENGSGRLALSLIKLIILRFLFGLFPILNHQILIFVAVLEFVKAKFKSAVFGWNSCQISSFL
jgi:hypothetical protein